MATESPQIQSSSNEATVTSDPEPAIKIDFDSQNVYSDRAQVNGDAASTPTDEIDNKHISDIVDDLVNSAEVSISGGSDNEAATKTDVSKLKDDEKGHGRTSSSVKKPTSFKSVSVNKTFLAAKGAVTNTPTKASDKPASSSGLSSAQSGALATAARPRLVAKSGSGLVAKGSLGTNGGKGVPDANAVWNKNRPVPKPEPKELTDEELKKYGIHMASRLQADDTKGQSAWADIDDDDDDWAPETITWKDGTKITIPQVEEHIPPPAPPPEPVIPPVIKDVEKPKSPAPAASPAVKPGVLASGKGLVLKGAPEKPTLVAKPPTLPAPQKSPWAALPKIDKASPLVMDLPAGGPVSRYQSRDGGGPTGSTPPPKEIAADDFSRTPWRDGPGNTRELYNSQSGRYEPVTDRRGSVRTESIGRQPALLQRASQHDMQGPAEPSAAFQTHRTSDQHPPYGRRRGSSIVSGGSGSFANRLKHDGAPQAMPPPELLPGRRNSLTAGSESPVTPRDFSPSGQPGMPRYHGNQQWQPRPSPGSAYATPHHPPTNPEAVPSGMPPPQAVAASGDDEFEEQRRLMKERRELAVKRRLEEEAQEKAEREERLRIKMEKLGPAPERKSERSGKKDTPSDGVQTAAGPQDRDPAQPSSGRTQANVADVSANQNTTSASVLNGLSPQAPSETASSQDALEAPPQALANSHAHPSWKASQNQPERYPQAQWGAAAQSARNLWGAPNNDRGLGNGTFSSDLGRISGNPPHGAQAPSQPTGPGPIGPPKKEPEPQAGPTRVAAAGPGGRPQPIGPPQSSARPFGAQASDAEKSKMRSTWVEQAQKNEQQWNDILNRDRAEEKRKLDAEGRTIADIQPAIQDSWRPTRLDDDGRRVYENQSQAITRGKNAWAADAKPAAESKKPFSQPQPQAGAETPSEATSRPLTGPNGPASSAQGRPSRFFPSRDVRLEAGYAESSRPKSPSPPPPDMDGHPAFDGDIARPHVSLPRPQPVVRLPPAAREAAPSTASQTKHSASGPAWGIASSSQAELSNTRAPPHSQRGASHGPGNNWQTKIDNLLNRNTTPPKSAGGDGSSRFFRQPFGALVSVPGTIFYRYAYDEDASTTTKIMAEQCFEEQEMGSLPPIRLPNKTPEAAWSPSPNPKPMPRKFVATPTSSEPIIFYPEVSQAGNVYRISLPQMAEAKTVTVAFTRSRSNPRPPRRGTRNPSQPHRGGRGRDGPSPHDSTPSGPGPNAAPSHRGRGGYRGSGRQDRSDWTRPTTAPGNGASPMAV